MGTQRISVSLLLAAVIVAGLGLGIFYLSGGGDESGEGAELSTGPGPEESGLDGGSDAGEAELVVEDDTELAEATEDSEESGDPSAVADDRPVSIQGRILDPDGEGIPGARVLALQPEQWEDHIGGAEERFRDPFEGIATLAREYADLADALEAVESADDGSYALRGLAPGAYDLVVSHIDYRPARSEGVRLEPDAVASRDVRLQPGESISGRVVDIEGDPVADALITYETEKRSSSRGMGRMIQHIVDFAEGQFLLQGREVRSDVDGAFRLGSLEPLIYEVRAKKDGFAPGRVGKVPAGAGEIVILLPAGSTVSGRVVGPGDEPVVGAEIELRAQRPDQRNINPMMLATMEVDFLGVKTVSAVSGDDGRFAVAGVTRGVFDYELWGDGFPVASGRVLIDEDEIDLGDLALERGMSITGVVRGSDGYGLEGALVKAVEAGSESRGRGSAKPRAETETDAKGRFELSGLVDGAYVVEAEEDNHASGRSDPVQPGGGADVTLELRAGRKLRGVVLSAVDRAPIAAAKVQVYEGARRSVVTGEDGAFELTGIAFGKDGNSAVGVRVTHASFESAWHNVEPENAESLELLLKQGRRARGIVVDRDGEPVAGARVRFVFGGMPEVFVKLADGGAPSVFSDDEGLFEIGLQSLNGPPVPPEIVAEHPRHGRGVFAVSGDEYKAMREARRQSRRVQAEGETAVEPSSPEFDDIRIVLGAGAAIVGRVLDTNGRAVTPARIQTSRSVESGDAETQLMMQMFPRATGPVGYTAADGTFRLDGVAAGIWDVEVSAIGYASEKIAGFEVPEEGEASLDVMLEGGGVVAGRVVDHDGEPLVGVTVVALPMTDMTTDESERFQAQMMRQLQKATAIGVAQASSGEDGRYELTHLPDGQFAIAGRRPGYQTGSVTEVDAGDEAPDIVLEAYAVLEGRVVDGLSGAPVSRFRLDVELQGEERNLARMWGRGRRDFEDPDGYYEVGELRAGEYEVRVSADGYVPGSKRLTIAPGEVATVDLIVDQGTAVRGVIADLQTGEPISGVNISLVYEDRERGRALGVRNQNERSSDDGSFSFDSVGDGAYLLSANHDTYYLEERQARVEVVDHVAVDLDVRMRLGAKLHGSLRAPSDTGEGTYYEIRLEPIEEEPAAGVTDTEAPERDEKPARAKFDIAQGWAQPNREYSVRGVRPGRYAVKVRQRSRGGNSNSELIDHGEVTVRAGEIVAFEIDVRE